MIGTSVDRYRIVEELGHGGMSVVYKGIDTSLERDVAVKVLHNHLARKADSRQRFHREAKAIARLKHPNILDVYDFSAEDAERSYIVMEFVQGDNLREFLARAGACPPEAAALIGLGICGALVSAHEHGIIHRDLKPENVMVSTAGDLKLMDFGIAHVIDAETMTQTGSLMGSPAHMSPEMIEGERVDARADVFALGTVLYWLCTGNLPFEGQNAPQVLKKVLQGQYERLTTVDPRVGRDFQAIAEKCMAHDPAQRYQTAREAQTALASYVADSGIESPELELKRYLSSPDAWKTKWEASLVGLLAARGKAALQAGKTLEAVALLDRALAYDPANSDVSRCLASIQARRRGAWVVGAVCVAGAMSLAVWLWPNPPPPVEQPEEVDPATAVAPAESIAERINDEAALTLTNTLAVNTAKTVLDNAARVAEAPPVLAVVPMKVLPNVVMTTPSVDAGVETQPEVDSYLYAFRVYPPAAQVVIAGRNYSSFEAAKGIELPLGRHVLTATSRGCKRFREVIDVAGPQAQRQDVVLNWEDGTVRVQTDTDALIFMGEDTRNISRRVAAGSVATFRFEFGPSDSENQQRTTFHIAPASDMTKRQTYSVVVRPGAVENINVAFRNR